MATRQAALLQILLVIVLGGIERDRGDDLGGDWLRVFVRLVERFLRSLRFLRLFGRMIENRGSVLRAPVRTLAVDLRRIVVLPENFKQVGIADLGRVIVDFHRLGVSGAVGANFLVGWILGLAADVPDAG